MVSPIQIRSKIFASLILASIAFLAFAQSALADGIIIPDPPPWPDPPPLEESWLTIRYHRVSISISDQIAVTRVEQEFLNENDWDVEGTYIFPVPDGASISKFVIWVEGKAIEGKILPADEARQIYEDIVRQRRDPALLEYLGKGAVQARIYPIPAGGSRKIELEYSQVLNQEDGLTKYVYPLNTEKFSARALEECSVRVELSSSQSLRSVYSPTHQDRIFIDRENDHQVTLGYEEYNVLPDQDFELIFTHSDDEVGLNLLTFPDLDGGSGLGQEGYFLLLAAPSVEVDHVIPRDIVLVLDTSGSMEGDKLFQAKEAARYVLTHLNPEDRFNVIAFSTGIKHFAYQLQPVSKARQAISWIENKPALGGTNINQALLEAIAQRNPTEDSNTARPLVVLFLTDGLPTEGVTEIDQILANTKNNSTHYLRLFSFGVGDDVNTELLDTLAEDNRGLVSYVRPHERIDEEVSGLFSKIQTPVLSNLELDFGDIMVEEIYPPELPDLFSGTQLMVAGRYRLTAGDTGRSTIRLSGFVDSKEYVYSFRADFKGGSMYSDVNSFIPRLWAARKIGYLLNQIRHQGENSEWVDAVIQLSIRYGIITPYTSFLIEEDDLFSGEGWEEEAHELIQDYASGPSVGSDAVGKAEAESNLRSAEAVPQSEAPVNQYTGEIQQPQLKYVGEKTFFLQGDIWIDSQYDGSTMEATQIGFGSDVYYQLLAARPDWGKFLALGEQVIFVADGIVYQIVPGEEGVSSLPPGLSEPVGSGGQVSFSDSIEIRSLCSMPFLTSMVMMALGIKFGF